MACRKKLKCACCGYLTIREEYDICPVCFWEADNVQNADIMFAGGANDVCLQTARENFATFGASDERFVDKVRKPLKKEFDKNEK